MAVSLSAVGGTGTSDRPGDGPAGDDDFGPLISDLDRADGWLADLRAREAVEARIRRRWLTTQAREETEFAEVMADLADRGAEVVVTTGRGGRLAGTVVAVGRDFVAMMAPMPSLVPFGAVASVTEATRRRPEPGAPPPAPPAATASWVTTVGVEVGRHSGLTDVLAQASGHRPRVRVNSGHEVVCTGELGFVGVDVVVVHLEGEPGGLAYLPASPDSELTVSFLDSG